MKYEIFEVTKVVQSVLDGQVICDSVPDDFVPSKGQKVFWGVYGRSKQGWADSIADFKKKKDADYICQVLNKGIGK